MSILRSNSLVKFRAGLARVVDGVGVCKVLCIGDSLTAGAYSNNSAVGDWRTLSYPSQLTNFLNSRNILAQRNSFMGAGDGNDYQHVPEITLGTGWATNTNTYSIGGQVFIASGATTSLAFTPTQNVDRFVIWYIQNGPLGKFKYNINGGSNTVVDTAGAGAFQSVTISTSLAANTLNINWDSVDAVGIIGVEAYDSSQKKVSVINAGWSGSQASAWALNNGSPWNTVTAVNTFAPDLVLLGLGGNEVVAKIPLDAYEDNMRVLIEGFLYNADVCLITPNPIDPGQYGIAESQQLYVDVQSNLAEEYGISIFDQYGRCGSFDKFNAAGMLYSPDKLHPIGIGYSDAARGIGEFLLGA